MKLLIELTDFYIEDGELNDCLVQAIKRDVVAQIRAQIKESTEKKIADDVQAAIRDTVQAQINQSISEFVESGVITSSGKEVKIVDHLRAVFVSSNGWNNPSEKLKELAKRFGEELKQQYNAIFATKIVMSMRDQGFLKEDVAQMLLGEKKA